MKAISVTIGPAHRRRCLYLCAALCALLAAPARALDPQQAISQYGYDVWQSSQGLPQGTVMSIAQTPDGYLWLGTPVGLVRFDGARFKLIEEETAARFGVWHLFVSRNGSLWVSTYGGGLLRWKDGQFSRYTTREGLSDDYVRTVYEDRAGGLWIGTFGQGVSVLRFFKAGDRFTHYTVKDGLAHPNVKSIVEDHAGHIWVATFGGGVSRFDGRRFQTFTERDGLPSDNVREIFRDRRGDLWFATPRGLGLLRGGRFRTLTERDGLSNDRVVALCEDRDGNLWVGTEGGGLCRYFDERFTSLTTQDGLASGDIKALFEDRAGSLWIGTNGGGLGRLRARTYTVYTAQKGLSDNHATAVCESRDGSLWVGTINGLNRFAQGRFTALTTRGWLSSNYVMALLKDRAGNLWVGTHSGGLNRISHNQRGGGVTLISRRDGLSHDIVNALCEDRRGNLWIGTAGGGLNVLSDGGRIGQFTTQDGLAGNWVLAMRETRDGSLWVGTRGGLSRLEFKDDCAVAPCLARVTNYATPDELPGAVISALHEDGDGTLWVGARDGGLARFKDGRWQSLTVKQGLAEQIILQILSDAAGWLWLFGDQGYSRLGQQELDDFFAGRRAAVKPFFLAREDGSGTSIFDVPGQPTAALTQQGQLWFPTLKGVTMIDPAGLAAPTAPPPIYLEQFVVDRQPLELSAGLSLPPGHRTYEFHYTGVSLLEAEKVRFRYQLEGFDQDWVEAGARRVAYYTNLPPGHYRFRVAARAGDGAWSEAAASPGFAQQPHVYQTYWFWAGVPLLGALSLWYLHHLRVRGIAAEHAAVLAERARLAREIHDSLIQGVVGVATHLELFAAALPESQPSVKDALDRLRLLIRNSLDEARRMILDLRPPALANRELAAALRDAAQRLTIDTPMQVEVRVDGAPRPLPRAIEEQLLRVGQEAVTNVVRHAQARRIEIELHYDAGCVRLLVHDDGRGFDPQSPAAQSPHHFGLVGMRERVEQCGGRLFVTSSPEEGTIVEAEIPERRAFAKRAS